MKSPVSGDYIPARGTWGYAALTPTNELKDCFDLGDLSFTQGGNGYMVNGDNTMWYKCSAAAATFGGHFVT